MTQDPMSGMNTGETDREAPADETFGWSADPSGSTTKTGREWVSQLQSMIENLAEQAAPVVREVGAKAAELAALAGEKAGPAAHKAAELTAEAGQKLAVKGRDLAAELRRDQEAAAGGPAQATTDDVLSTTDETIAGDAP
jgi:hypothetical protein